VSLPEAFSGTLVLSEALVFRLLSGWTQCLPPQHLDVLVDVLGETATAKAHSLVWHARGSSQLPAGYTPPRLESQQHTGSDGSGASRAGRAAVVPTLAAGKTSRISLLLPPPPPSQEALCASHIPATPCDTGTAEDLVGDLLFPFPAPSYPALFLGQDSVTAGDWVGQYGSDGGVLFGGGPGGDDTPRSFLPPYVHSVTAVFSESFQGTWDTGLNTSDRRAPANPQTTNASALRTAGYIAGNPTFAVDVVLGGGVPSLFTVAAYVVDFDSKGRRQTVALLDGDTFNPLSPIQGLRGMEEGVWLPWVINTNITTSKGFRLRISQTRGDNAVLCALLFGTAPTRT